MKSLSVTMIVKDEADVIERVLKCASKFADEIILIDTGSTDNTIEVAKQYTEKIYNYVWTDDFSSARNFGIDKCTGDYFMWMDADDVVPDKTISAINKWKQNKSDVDVLMMPYNISFDENNNPIFTYYRERILRNNGFKFEGRVHECIVPKGKIGYLDFPIEHRKIKASKPKRNLKIYEKMEQEGKEFNARENFYYANELFYNNMYDDAIPRYLKVIYSADAFIENRIQACVNLAVIYKEKNMLGYAKELLFKTFEFDLPRPEPVCRIAEIYYTQKDYKRAIFWYKVALMSDCDAKTGAFINKEFVSYLPNLMLAVCYYNLKDKKTALKFNKEALKSRPNDKLALKNQTFYV